MATSDEIQEQRDDYNYDAWCGACSRVTSHQYGQCTEHREGFPRPAIMVPAPKRKSA